MAPGRPLLRANAQRAAVAQFDKLTTSPNVGGRPSVQVREIRTRAHNGEQQKRERRAVLGGGGDVARDRVCLGIEVAAVRCCPLRFHYSRTAGERTPPPPGVLPGTVERHVVISS